VHQVGFIYKIVPRKSGHKVFVCKEMLGPKIAPFLLGIAGAWVWNVMQCLFCKNVYELLKMDVTFYITTTFIILIGHVQCLSEFIVLKC